MTALTDTELARWLADLIRIPSPSGREPEALQYLAQEFSALAPEVFLQEFPSDLFSHPEYRPDPTINNTNLRENLIVRWPGHSSKGDHIRLILQTHVDTVPWHDWPNALKPNIVEGRVIGRGACDCKGQIAMLYQMAHILEGLAFTPSATLEVQIVAEEEIGGNGALATVLQRPWSEGVIVLEPTGLRSFSANRGALWFRIDIQGEAGHMSNSNQGVSAIKLASRAIEALGRYETELLQISRGLPPFEEYDGPVRVNIGTICGGDWPSTVAAHCFLEGGVGYLPNKNIQDVKADLQMLLDNDPLLRKHSTLTCNRLRNEAFATDPRNLLVRSFCEALAEHGLPSNVAGWNASCDARLYATVGRMPVLVFGAGDLAEAHSAGESISLGEIAIGSRLLAGFVRTWCD